jgi:DNA polymerase-1
MDKPTLLIDGDMILYTAAAGSESVVQWDDDWWIMGGNLQEAKELVSEKISNLEDRFAPSICLFCLSDTPLIFRAELDPSYKAGRSRKPMVYAALREWALEAFQCLIRPKLEADDVMGILATSPKTRAPVIVSDDKDMLTIPGVAWRLGELVKTTPEQAWEKFLTQVLTGDATDGYSGCPGCGPVGAEKVLKKGGYTFETVVKAFENAGKTRDDALLQARMARILHHSDWDAKNQTVRLWTPPELQESNTAGE